MFKKILIANRGEIACRIIQTARAMGIATIAVYSDADRRARHVRLADEAYHIGGAASRESYLKGAVILDVARACGAEAIHPGYGFLSENEDFARACAQAGIKFIGPSAESINAMGLKDKAKALMEKAGVPVVPGYQGAEQEAGFLQARADEIGYPVLIKAVAGGGGKGMRLVARAEDFAQDLASCQREAAASFGNDHVLIEKYIQKPRHVEVQVFGDSHGGAVHLYERDCSLQRRHQKVVEEAPAPGLPDDVRAALGTAAVKAVQALGYENAGTIEFIMDSQSHEFFFMEMNTRLQVEHPVTEMVTGFDLVEWQLRVAAGESLPRTQDQIALCGHAFEVRLYAEDPAGEFLPQTGRVTRFIAPPQARVDTGIEDGDEVSIHYDPMIAKIIVAGKDREEALHKMQQALAGTGVAGLTTNQEFLSRIFAQPDFAAGQVDTGFIARFMDELVPATYGQPDQDALALAALWFMGAAHNKAAGDGGEAWPDIWDSGDSWRMNSHLTRSLQLVCREQLLTLTVTCKGRDYQLSGDDFTVTVRFESLNDTALTAAIDGRRITAHAVGQGRDLSLYYKGRALRLHLYVPGSADDETGEGKITAPMPGKIINVMVAAGDSVEKDQPLLVMEAMKMEMTIRAGCAGVVEELPVAVNDQVGDGALLVSIKGEDAA